MTCQAEGSEQGKTPHFDGNHANDAMVTKLGQ